MLYYKELQEIKILLEEYERFPFIEKNVIIDDKCVVTFNLSPFTFRADYLFHMLFNFRVLNVFLCQRQALIELEVN